MRNILKQNATLRRAYYRVRLAGASGQSDEGKIIERLVTMAPKTFIEIGFHPIEFNCIKLARSRDWRGLLVDGSKKQVADATALFSDRIQIVQSFLTLDNMDFIKDTFDDLGVLSIDVDGNDYWFLKALIDTKPSVICTEYNSSFGLEPITVPYDASFDRHKKHPKGWYHGASLTALAFLCREHGYGLAAISQGGANAFFTRGGTLDPCEVWKPNFIREKLSGCDHATQWNAVKHLPFVTVK